jgi:hypothetical protein
MQSYVPCDERPVTQKQITQHDSFEIHGIWYCKEAAMLSDQPMIMTNANHPRAHLKTQNFQSCKDTFTISKTVGLGEMALIIVHKYRQLRCT